MWITKEMGYQYLKSRRWGENKIFEVVDVSIESKRTGVNPHPVIKCKINNGKSEIYRNIHVDLSNIIKWNRENIIKKILNN